MKDSVEADRLNDAPDHQLNRWVCLLTPRLFRGSSRFDVQRTCLHQDVIKIDEVVKVGAKQITSKHRSRCFSFQNRAKEIASYWETNKYLILQYQTWLIACNIQLNHRVMCLKMENSGPIDLVHLNVIIIILESRWSFISRRI